MIRSVFSFALARGLPAVLSFTLMAVLTHLLAPQEYGRLTLALTTGALVATVAYQWLILAFFRFAGNGHSEGDDLFPSVGATFLAVTLLVALCTTLLVVGIVAPGLRWLLVAGTCVMVGQAWLDLNLQLLAARSRASEYGVLGAARIIFALALALPLAYVTRTAVGALSGLALSLGLVGLWGARYWRGVGVRGRSTARVRTLALYGSPLAMQYALEVVIAFADRFLLAALAGVAAAGTYAIGYDLSQQSLGMIMIVVNLAGYPRAMRAHDGGDVEATRIQLTTHARLLVAVAIPAATGIGVLAPSICAVMLGRQYVETAALVIPVIAAAGVLSGLKAFYFDIAFQITKRTAVQGKIALAAVVINTIGNILAIPRYGALGAAGATLLTYAGTVAASAIIGRRHYVLPLPWTDWAKSLLSAAVMAAIIWPFRATDTVAGLVLAIVVGAGVYGSVAVALDVAALRAPMMRRLRAHLS